MKISVIVAAYNIEDYIERCLNSIIKQMNNEIQLIIVNDGSKDNTLNKINSCCNDKNNIRIINKENQGLIEARKSGMNIASGEYILFVDGDDWIEDNAIKILYESAIVNNSDLVIYNGYWVHDTFKKKLKTFNSDEVINNSPIKSLFLNHISPGIVFKLIKKEYLIKNSIKFPSDISYAEDLATTTSLFMYSPKISYVNDNLYNYFQRSSSISKVINKNMLDIDKAIDFIEINLKSNNLYELYSKEFERMVYTHLFAERILPAEKIYPIHRELYAKFKKRKINYNKNIYFKEYLRNNRLIDRIRIKLYLKNIRLGEVFDYTKKILKKFLNLVRKK